MSAKGIQYANVAIEAYCAECCTRKVDALGDLLGCLMQWADASNEDFESALRRTRRDCE